MTLASSPEHGATIKESLTVAARSVPDKLLGFIATRDRRCERASGYGKAPISEYFTRLLRGDVVRVGGRSSCGGKVDASWVELTAWNEVVRKARSLGFEIEVAPIKHKNAWATKAGGFWYENDYRLTVVNQSQTTDSRA